MKLKLETQSESLSIRRQLCFLLIGTATAIKQLIIKKNLD